MIGVTVKLSLFQIIMNIFSYRYLLSYYKLMLEVYRIKKILVKETDIFSSFPSKRPSYVTVS